MAWGSMFMVPPGRGAISGPSGPQSSAAARAVPSPARTISRSGDFATAAARHSVTWCGSGVQTWASSPASARMAVISAGAVFPTLPDATLATTSTVLNVAPKSVALAGRAGGLRLRSLAGVAQGLSGLAGGVAHLRFRLVDGGRQVLV